MVPPTEESKIWGLKAKTMIFGAQKPVKKQKLKTRYGAKQQRHQYMVLHSNDNKMWCRKAKTTSHLWSARQGAHPL